VDTICGEVGRTCGETTAALPRARRGRAVEIRIGVNRTEVEALERRDVHARDEREVVAAEEAITNARGLLFDLGVGKVDLDRRDDRDRDVRTGEVTCGEGGKLVRDRERLRAETHDGAGRRPRQRELGVGPLDLERGRHICVQVGAEERATSLTHRSRRRCAEASGLSRATEGHVIARWTRGAPRVVELEAEHELGGAELADDVRTSTRPRIPLLVYAGRVEVPERHVPRPRRDVVDQSVDRHLRGRSRRRGLLSVGVRNQKREDDENGGDNCEQTPHDRLLMWKVKRLAFDHKRGPTPTPTHTRNCGHFVLPGPRWRQGKWVGIYPPSPMARSRSAAAWPKGDCGDRSRTLRKAALASSLRFSAARTRPRW